MGDFANTIRVPIHLFDKFPEYWTCQSSEESRAACEHDHSAVEAALRIQPQSLDSYLDLQWDGHYAESGHSLDDRIATDEFFTDDPGTVAIETEFTEVVNRLVDTSPHAKLRSCDVVSVGSTVSRRRSISSDANST